MAICAECGKEFDIAHARRVIGGRYGAGSYNDYCPEGGICEWCIDPIIGADWSAGAEIKELMGNSWWKED